MELREFAQKVQYAVQDKLGADFQVELKEVRKNNGVMLQGIMFSREDRNVMPTIYLEPFWKAYIEGMPFGDVIRDILNASGKERAAVHIDMEFFRDFGKVKDRICCRVVGTERNGELLREIPHVEFLDLAVCFFYAYQGDVLGEGSILIYNSHVKMWGTDTAELMRLAMDNTPRLFPWQCSTMKEVLREIMGPKQAEELYEGEVPMKVLSNRQHVHGASCMLYRGVMERLAEEWGADLYILPSSVHEVILLEDTGERSAVELRDTIRQANRTQLEPEEILSDSLYRFDRSKKRFEIIL